MEMSVSEVIDKLEELEKVRESIERAIRTNKRCEINNKYANVPIEILSYELENLIFKIKQFKNDAVVTYNCDLNYMDKFLNVSDGEMIEKEAVNNY